MMSLYHDDAELRCIAETVQSNKQQDAVRTHALPPPRSTLFKQGELVGSYH